MGHNPWLHFGWMNIDLPPILIFTTGTRGVDPQPDGNKHHQTHLQIAQAACSGKYYKAERNLFLLGCLLVFFALVRRASSRWRRASG